jgi:hypothetical protein
MMDSRLSTISVGMLQLTRTAGDTLSAETKKTAPTVLTAASKKPLRVVIDNVSFAAEVYLALDSATLQSNEPGGETFQLQAGRSVTIMLAPDQRLYAISLSVGAQVSLAISEALPIDTKP